MDSTLRRLLAVERLRPQVTPEILDRRLAFPGLIRGLTRAAQDIEMVKFGELMELFESLRENR